MCVCVCVLGCILGNTTFSDISQSWIRFNWQITLGNLQINEKKDDTLKAEANGKNEFLLTCMTFLS